MAQSVPVLAWRQSDSDTLIATYNCDASIDSQFVFFLYGTDPAGGSNKESEIKASVVIIDNFANNSSAKVIISGGSYSVAPYTRKSFPIRKDQRTFQLTVSLGIVGLIFANKDIGIPDDINQYAQTSGQVISSTTFDPLDLIAFGALSNGNLTVINTGGVGGALSDLYKGSGKLYFEMLLNVGSGAGCDTGCVTAAYDRSMAGGSIGIGPASFGVDVSGTIRVAGSSLGNLGGAVINAGDTVKIAVNATSQQFWAAKVGQSWMGIPANDPASGVGGISYSAIGNPIKAGATGGAGQSWTANFGGTPFLNPLPAGFTGWL